MEDLLRLLSGLTQIAGIVAGFASGGLLAWFGSHLQKAREREAFERQRYADREAFERQLQAERQKLALGRGDILFARQIEALGAIAKFIAQPMNVFATTLWLPGSGVHLLRRVNMEELSEEYLRIAAENFFPLGPEMVHLIDDLHTQGWEFAAKLLLAKSEQEFNAAREQMTAHRDRCLEAADAYLNHRASEALHSSMENPHGRLTQAVLSIQQALPQIEQRSGLINR